MDLESTIDSKDSKAKLEYLKELLIDRNLLTSDPLNYLHLGNILENEILKVRSSLFSSYGIRTISDVELPEPEGPKLCTQTKVYMPTDANNSFNFVGRILGPDGSTAKCLQQCLGVKIMVRGRGSMRDRKKEEANIGKPNWEHLNDRLHIVLAVEDYANRAKARLARASDCIGTFLKESMKSSDKEDRIKQMQLMELSFRRDSWRSWPCNRHCVTDPSWSPKPGSSLSHAANLLNFGYCYPQPPLFPAFQDDGQHHHLPHHPHFSALGQSSTPTLSGTNQHSSMASLSHQFPPNFSTTVLLGHGPLPGCFNGLYTPNSGQPQTGPTVATSLTAGSLAMAPMSYWHGPPMSQLTESHPTVTMNRLGPHEDSTVALMGGNILNTNVASGSSPPLQAGNGTAYSVFLSQPMQSQLCGMLPDQAAQYVFADFTAPCLNGAPEVGFRDASITTSGGLRSTVCSSTGWNASPAGADGSFLTSPPKHGSKQRYSQKHAYHANCHSSPNAVKSSTGTRCSSRSTVVSVKVSQHNHHTSKCNGDMPKEKGNTGFSRHIIPSDMLHDKGFIPQPCTPTAVQLPKKSISTTVNGSNARTKFDVDLEWPRLGAMTPNSLKNKSSPGPTASEP